MNDTIDISSWNTPASKFPDGIHGGVKFKTSHYRGLYHAHMAKGYLYYQAHNIPIKGLYLKEGRKWKMWMIDDPCHWWTIQEHAMKMKGHVLVAGLGLGLILYALLDNPDVTEITVVEINKDLIDFMAPYIEEMREKKPIYVVEADFNTYRPTSQVDSIFYDLFVGSGKELFMYALGVYLDLKSHFGDIPIRILGFPNDKFEEIYIGQELMKKEMTLA